MIKINPSILSKTVKAITPKTEKVEEAQIRGTIVYRNQEHFVQLDGAPSNALTPIAEFAEGASDAGFVHGDRVLVLIKNHQAIVTKNLTVGLQAQAAKEASAFTTAITDEGITAQRIIANDTFTNTLRANHITADEIIAGMATIDTLDANYAHITDGVIDNAKIGVADVNDLRANYAHITTGVIDNAKIDYADVNNLSANYAHITNGVIDNAKIGYADVDDLDANYAHITQGVIDNAKIDVADVNNLSANYAHITNGVIDNAKIGVADVNDLSANYAHITNGVIDNAKIGYADVNNLNANYAHITSGVIDNAKIGYADVNDLNAHYASINLANVNNAWIQNGVIKNGAIADAQIIGVSANKLTAGTIDASNITVTNLNASNITTGSITVDGITIDVENNEASIDGGYIENGTVTLSGLAQDVTDKIDGAIETFTGAVVPTLNNYPASSWTTTKVKDSHIGDVYYVLNADNTSDGYCYRFTKDGNTYKWVLIKDSDVTAALSRLTTAEGKISGLESFESTTSSWITNTDEEISSIKTNHTTLVGVVDKTLVETVQLWFTKANTTAPNKPTARVTTNDASKPNMWNIAVPTYNSSYPNYYYCYQWKYADGTYGWSSVTRDIAMGESQNTARTAASDASAAVSTANTASTNASNAVSTANTASTNASNAVSTANSASSTASAAQTTANSAASDASAAVSTANTASTNASNAVSTANTAKATADKNVKKAVQLWYTKANTTAPGKPTAHVTSTSTDGNAWRTVVPTYNASYPYYYYCYEYESADGTYTWSDVVYDRATSEAEERARTAVTNAATAQTAAETADGKAVAAQTAATTADGKAVAAQNTANANIKSTVQLWFTKANTTAPSKPSAHVTNNNPTGSNSYNKWNIAVPEYNSTYPNYFYCYEYQKGDNTYAWSDVVFDKATTENQANARSALSQVATKVETSTFNTLSQTVDSNTANITSLTTITENNGLTASTNITNTVNTVNQTATGNSSKISQLTTTLGTNADGTTKTGDIVHRTSAVEQDLSGFKTTVSSTYETKTDANNAYLKGVSRGEQLVTNGNGMLGNNTNFSQWTFDGSVANSSPGSFTRIGGYANIGSDEHFTVSADKRYRFEFDMKSANNVGTMYSMLLFYDVDKRVIAASDTMFYANTLTTLTQELKAGDTVVHLADVSKYKTYGTSSHQRALTFWDYKNTFGYQYPPETYSRNHIWSAWTDDSSIDKTNNTITLATAYTGVTKPVGTYVSQGNSGATYKYGPLRNNKIPVEWTHYVGYFDGIDYSGLNKSGMFPPATAYCKVGFLWNENSADDQFWVTNIQVYEDYKTAIDNVTAGLETVKTTYVKNSTFETTTDAIRGEISAVETTTKSYTDGKISQEVTDRNSAITQKANEITQSVSETYQTKNDMSGYSTTQQMNSAINQKANEITQSVSETYQTKAAMSDYSTTTQMNSAINQKADEISTRVGKTEAHLIGMYATSSTAAGTAAKVATITPAIPSGTTWELSTGTTITVKFTNANTTASPTLNVNSKGAKPIKTYANGNLSEAEYKWKAGSTFTFTYNGTNWLMQDSSASVRMNTNETQINQTADSIISLASGNTTYTKPDGTTATSAIGTTVSQTANNVLIKATRDGASAADKTAGGTSAIGLINVSPDNVVIAAKHVDIAGAAVFNNYSTTTEMNTAIGNAIDDIEVGGRNLVPKSQNMKAFTVENSFLGVTYTPTSCTVVNNSSNQAAYGLYYDINVESGEKYILSATFSNVSGTVKWSIGDRTDGTSRSEWTGVDGYNAITNGLNTKAFSIPSNCNKIRIYIATQANGSRYTISNLKLEKGTKATDWTPALDDIRSTHTVTAQGVDASYPYENILTFSEQLNSTWDIGDNTGINVGDTVRVKVIASNMGKSGTPVYVVGTVTYVNPNGSYIKIDGHGLDTTVIDGGHILTGTIDANKVNISTLNVSSSSGWNGLMNSNIQIGGRNLCRNTGFNDLSMWYGSPSVSDGKLTITTATEVGLSLDYRTNYTIPIGTQYTVSCYFYENTIADGNRRIYFCSAPEWDYWTVPANFTGLFSRTGTAWQEITQLAIDYDTRGMTSGKWVVGPVKIELGNKATDWTPAPEDMKSVHTLMAPGGESSSSATYAQIVGWCKEGTTQNWNVTSTAGVKKGDTVRVGYYVSNMGTAGNRPVVYCVGTVTAILSSVRLTMTMHGLDTTIIDGGSIITDSITANQIAANAITSDELAANAVTAGKIAANAIDTTKLTVGTQNDVLNSNIQIGGRNLCKNTGFNDLSMWYGSPSVSDGKLTITTATEVGINGNYRTSYTIPAGTSYTVSCYFYKNTIADGNRRIYFRDQPAWDYLTVPANFTGLFSRTTTSAQDITRLTVEYDTRGATSGKWVVGPVKIELGNKATDWTPAPEDVAATATNYITHIDDNGIRIHPSSTQNNSVVINASGMEVFKGGTAAANSVAFYGDTARVGKSSTRHIEVKDGGMQVYQDSTYVMAHIGYGTTNNGSGTETAPYYTFGHRNSGYANGKYSVCEGYDCAASQADTHAEGVGTKATASAAHSEGSNTTASGYYSHAEGYQTTASGYGAHASGYGTTAQAFGQTAVGRYNVAQGTSNTMVATDNAFIVGNGSSLSSRSNALAVTYQGKMTIAGTLTQGSDRRLKEHISYLGDEAVKFIDGLKPAHYIKDGEKHVGFYAQDVEAVDEWGCMTGEMNGYMTLGYMELLAPMVAYIQRLEKRIEELERSK